MHHFLKFIFTPLLIAGTISLSTVATKNTSHTSLSYSSAGECSTGKVLVQPNTERFLLLQNYFKPKSYIEDTSIDRFVSRTVALNDRFYVPHDLVPIASSGIINEAGRVSQLRQEARDALWMMAKDFRQEFGEPIIVISGYRSGEYQQRLWNLGRCTSTLCAPPGYSEHQLGLAVDLFDASTKKDYLSNPRYRKYITWLKNNAHLYGWHQSYQNGASIDLYEEEPWHWRYLGRDLAVKLHDLDWSYTEYIRLQDTLDGRLGN